MEHASTAWRLWLALALSVVALAMTLLSIGSDAMLTILASAVLLLLCWTDPIFPVVQGSFLLVVTSASGISALSFPLHL